MRVTSAFPNYILLVGHRIHECHYRLFQALINGIIVFVGSYCSLRHVTSNLSSALLTLHFDEDDFKRWRFFDSRNAASRRHGVHALYCFIGYELVHSFSMRW